MVLVVVQSGGHARRPAASRGCLLHDGDEHCAVNCYVEERKRRMEFPWREPLRPWLDPYRGVEKKNYRGDY